MAKSFQQRKLDGRPLSGPFRPAGGFGWIADLPAEFWGETDTNEESHHSGLRMREDGHELGPAHATHAAVQDLGEGRYSFWDTVAYFSASDGSDPNTNGRSYSVARAEPRSGARAVLRAITPPGYMAEWSAPDRPLRCAVVGLGNRGWSLARLVTRLDGAKVAWLVDSSAERASELRNHIGVPGLQTGPDLSTALADPGVDAVFVTLPDHLHRAAAEQAFRAGKNVFLEKPLATTAADGLAILKAWQTSGRVLQIGYVLRQAPFYQAIRNVIRQGRLGPVRVISLSEQLDVLHGASFMRRWHRHSAHSGGLIVHKSCHDLDLICWLLDSWPRLVSSFAGLGTFDRSAPAPFCSQCPERADCAYVDRGLHERRSAAERANPSAFGLDRCVFRSDKDIVDNQVVAFEMANGVRGTFQLVMQGRRTERRITVIGDDARLDGVLEDGRFTLTHADEKPISWSTDQRDGHGGGDLSTVTAFLNACLGRSPPPITSAPAAMAGLAFAAAAETARKTRSVVTLSDADFEIAMASACTGLARRHGATTAE